ncbi:MAG: TIGR00730 family Rossman fold protein [Calditrichaeota bacterium]|nr:TIGR00730 family Rossman fold protein [Calditrichota bacterium]
MRSIAVFCDSSIGIKPEYLELTRYLGEAIAKRGICLIFTGTEGGIVGELAKTVIHHNGKVIGVFCESLAHSAIIYDGLTTIEIVATMDEQKSRMAELADAFIALPGGFSTIQNITDMLKLAAMGIHRKPCGILNINKFFNRFVEFLDHVLEEEFIGSNYKSLLLVDQNPWGLLKKLDEFRYSKILH